MGAQREEGYELRWYLYSGVSGVSVVGIWGDLGPGPPLVRCSASLHPAGGAGPQGVHFSHIDPILAPELCPMDYTAGTAPGAPVSMARALRMDSSRRKDVVLNSGNARCGIQLEPPASPHVLPLAISSGTVFFLAGKKSSESGRKGESSSLSGLLQYLPTYSHTRFAIHPNI